VEQPAAARFLVAMAETMKAICIHHFGGLDALSYQDLPRPEPGRGELLIRVHAAGVNPVDWKTRNGSVPWKGQSDPFPLILGWDLSGTVVAVDRDVTGFAPGDAIYGMIRFPEPAGTYAEYATAPADHVLPKPAALDFLEAAALPLVSLTAWQALFEAGELDQGQTVLIHGAAGGVGHVAVQLAKSCGARVIGTARGRDGDYLRELGLDLHIDFETTRFEDVVPYVDLVLDPLGGEVQQRSWEVLRKGGMLVSLRTTSDLEEKARAYGVRVRRILVRPQAEHFARINGLVETGQLRPTIAAVYPLQEARKAQEQLERGPTRGKVVLRVGSDDA
jgi:NADPH:quinone reductase-like Zn-dependent oxidoreductase